MSDLLSTETETGLFAVDEKGGILTGDRILAICAEMMKGEGTLTNNLVIDTVMSNIGFGLALKRLGIEKATAPVGDRYVLEMMKEKGASIGGEDSGHIIFLNHHTTGDGILSALQVLAANEKDRETPFRTWKDNGSIPLRDSSTWMYPQNPKYQRFPNW